MTLPFDIAARDKALLRGELASIILFSLQRRIGEGPTANTVTARSSAKMD
jgi:hypothetical protein